MSGKGNDMGTSGWFGKMLDEYREDFDYRFEEFILAVNEKICGRMKEIKINRAGLAERMGISRPAVTNMLDGNSNFTLKRLLAVADALDLELCVDFKAKSDRKRIDNDMADPKKLTKKFANV